METTKSRYDEICERYRAIGMEPIRQSLHEFKRQLSEVELADIAKDMTEHILQKNQLENEKKDYDKAMKVRIDKEDAQATALAQVYDNGFEEVEGPCVEILDKEDKVIRIVDLKSGMEVGKRAIQDRDLQTTILPSEPEEKAPEAPENPEEAPPAPEAIGIGYDGGKADGGPIEVDGVVVSDDEIVAGIEDAKEAETKTCVDMIQGVSAKDGVAMIEAVENTFFTDSQAIADKAAEIGTKGLYAKITYEDAGTRNHKILKIEESLVEDPTPAVPLPEGVLEPTEDFD